MHGATAVDHHESPVELLVAAVWGEVVGMWIVSCGLVSGKARPSRAVAVGRWVCVVDELWWPNDFGNRRKIKDKHFGPFDSDDGDFGGEGNGRECGAFLYVGCGQGKALEMGIEVENGGSSHRAQEGREKKRGK
ncbi:hypothetical protein [Oryza sativa Japonica Group]|uniref:Os01g0210100 protein n=2 Tax=Oryza sativa subsp. japonica TaxID=39947 RepID=Q5QNH6_ORYSJ|nr:hypothetical protein [Oryza sativa Japonica Group]BAD73043.1 hypothetical protein [Oryza sativa Japonica Group]BAS70979.1 Os01g0210100 [Oryza sativa Japonica Group]